MADRHPSTTQVTQMQVRSGPDLIARSTGPTVVPVMGIISVSRPDALDPRRLRTNRIATSVVGIKSESSRALQQTGRFRYLSMSCVEL